MGESGRNRFGDWDYLKRLAALKALAAGERDKTFDEFMDETFTVKGRESTSPDAPVKQPYYPSPDPCSGGCVGYRTGCTYSHCWG